MDIVTSSPILAERDSLELVSFYKMLGLSVTNNLDCGYNGHGIKSCYHDETDIIYGDASYF